MKGQIRYQVEDRMVEKEVSYIPFRYIAAVLIALLEVAAILTIVIVLCKYVPYFYLLVWATEIACVIRIIASDDNPDYKIPWLMLVLLVPVAGFMCYFLFYSRKLKRKYVRRLSMLKQQGTSDDSAAFANLEAEEPLVATQARMLCKVADSHLFSGTSQQYFPLGEDMDAQMLRDLRRAEKFIFMMEYFIVEEGLFWNSILEILKEKAAAGVEVRVVYDGIGCIMTLPGNYDQILRGFGIEAVPFSKLKGNADSEFNNRSHRKITVIDGIIGYTGGVNIADEYINRIEKYGHWKDVGVRLEGAAVRELTRLFLVDYGINVRKMPEAKHDYFPEYVREDQGYLIPFGDGPSPIYERRVGKCVIQNMLNQATRYVCIMTPYLIIDNELCQTIENTAVRGVNVKLILPHVPDKKLVFEMTRSHYRRLMDAGVEIYEYEPGFVHGKCYLADDEVTMVGTINLDYRSLVHHFENGVWMYRCRCIDEIRTDFADTLKKCIRMDDSKVNWTLPQRFLRAVMKVFAPML